MNAAPSRPIAGRLLDLEYLIEVDDADLAAYLRAVMADSAGDVDDPVRLSLRRVGDATDELRIDGEVTEQGTPPWILSMLHWHLNRRAVASVVDRPAIHAGAVGSADGSVLVVGASGASKTTTALALARAGFAYLTDDIVVLAGPDALRGSAKPVGLRAGTWEVLGIDEASVPAPPLPYRSPFSRQVAASALAPHCVDRVGRPRVLVFPERETMTPGRLEELPRSVALTRLIDACFNPDAVGPSLLSLLAPLAEGAVGYRWEVGPLDGLRRTVHAAWGRVGTPHLG